MPQGVPSGTPGVLSSQVHTLETNPQRAGSYITNPQYGSLEHASEPVTEAESNFRHSGWAVRRFQTWQSFGRLQIGERRKDRFANCGSGLFLQTNEAGDDLHLSCNKCHDRWCVACQNDRAALIREKVCQHMSGRHVRFLTLTLRHSPTPLLDQIKRLYRSFNNFRRRESWKRNVKGGVAFFETKISETDGLWHNHLHILIEGSFWDVKEISREWHAVTGDSCIVKLKAISTNEMLAAYVTKYVTKPADSSVYSQAKRFDELVISLKGVRLALPFGTWQHLNLMEKPKLDVKWISIARVDVLRDRARENDVEAIRWIEAASRKWPLFASIFTLTDSS